MVHQPTACVNYIVPNWYVPSDWLPMSVPNWYTLSDWSSMSVPNWYCLPGWSSMNVPIWYCLPDWCGVACRIEMTHQPACTPRTGQTAYPPLTASCSSTDRHCWRCDALLPESEQGDDGICPACEAQIVPLETRQPIETRHDAVRAMRI